MNARVGGATARVGGTTARTRGITTRTSTGTARAGKSDCKGNGNKTLDIKTFYLS